MKRKTSASFPPSFCSTRAQEPIPCSTENHNQWNITIIIRHSDEISPFFRFDGEYFEEVL